MLPLHDFFRATPPDLLKQYFEQRPFTLPPLDWSLPQRELASVQLNVADALDPTHRHVLLDDAERISLMAREDGEAAPFNALAAPE